MGTIIVGSILAAAVVAVITSLVKNKIRGKTNCGCGCEGCSHAGKCTTTTTRASP